MWRRYDDGHEELVNIDFSPVVIREMLVKNLRPRPRMRWQVPHKALISPNKPYQTRMSPILLLRIRWQVPLQELNPRCCLWQALNPKP